MKAFLDTTVFIATFYADHQHHHPSLELFLRYEKQDVACGAHSLAEIYSNLTGMPGKYRVTGDEALLFLEGVRNRMTVIALSADEVFRTIEASSGSVFGGGIYDALLGRCASKCEAEALYTWNTKDFTRLGPDIAGRVRTP